MINKKYPIILLFFASLFVQSLSAQEAEVDSWNQFRGPNRDGVYQGESLPDQLPEAGPELFWKKSLGEGFSEIIISGDRLYTMHSEAVDTVSGTEYVAAYDVQTGDEIWKSRVDSMFFDQFGDGPRSTPVIDEEYIFSQSSYGKITAHAKSDGKMIWQTDLMANYGSPLPRWGFSSSPVLVGNTLIIEAGGTESRGFVGLDKKTGALKWAKENGLAGYSSPVIAKLGEETRIIFASQTTLFSFNAEGDTLWTSAMTMNGPMASPVVFEGNKIFISTVRSDGFIIVEVVNNKATEILNGSSMKNDFSSSLYYNGHIYGFNIAALQCISATTGEKKWTKRGFGKGTLILVDDNLLVLSDKGKLIQVKATPDAYTEQGSFQALQGKSWTAPSFIQGKLFVRNLTEMACYRLK